MVLLFINANSNSAELTFLNSALSFGKENWELVGILNAIQRDVSAVVSQFEKKAGHQVPECILRHPGLVTDAERELLFCLARDHFRGDGLVIDAGTFLGASAVALSEGMRAARRPSGSFRPIRSYDIAIWYDSMNVYLERAAFAEVFSGRIIRQGESFEPELRHLISPYADLVELVIGNLIQTAKVDQPIEIAFFDCLKTNERDVAAFRAFAPHYVPGHTIILQQDYFYESAAFNKIRQEYFSDHFEYLGRTATTAAFLYQEPIEPADIVSDPVSRLPLERQVELIQQAAMRTKNPKARILAELAVTEHLINAGKGEWARLELTAQEELINAHGPGLLSRRPENIVRSLKDRLTKLDSIEQARQ